MEVDIKYLKGYIQGSGQGLVSFGESRAGGQSCCWEEVSGGAVVGL